jgi:hypothetical protein
MFRTRRLEKRREGRRVDGLHVRIERRHGLCVRRGCSSNRDQHRQMIGAGGDCVKSVVAVYPAAISENWDCNHSIHGSKLAVTANEASTRSVARVSPLASRAAWTPATLCDRERDRPICERTQGPAPRLWLAPQARPAALEARLAASEPSRPLAPRRWNARLHRLDCPSRSPVTRPCESWETHRRSGVNGVWSRLLERVAGLQRPAGREGLPEAAYGRRLTHLARFGSVRA